MTPLTRPAPARPPRVGHGAALTFETLVEGQALEPRLRMHDDTLLRVIAGIVHVTIEAEARGSGPARRSSSPPGRRIASPAPAASPGSSPVCARSS